MIGAARTVFTLAPGAVLSAAIALAATFIAQLHEGPQMLYALFFGIVCNQFGTEARTRPGIEFCARQVLRLGVGLLGARITAEQIAALGWFSAGIVMAAMVTTMACGVLLAGRLQMTRARGVLAGGAVAICGASAALAIAAVLPREKHGDRFTLIVVIGVTVMSTAAMVIYPLVARALSLPQELAGLFIGATIHDVAQVVGAGYTLGPQTGDIATVVKLFRVALLALVVLVVGWVFRAERMRSEPVHAARQPLVPWFLWLFVAMVAINSLGALNAPLQQALGWSSRACLVVAITALGMKTSFMQLAQAGWRPVVLILVETVWMAVFVLAAIVWWA
jgi:uncharacterized integral membrane protein (TIGR00698 family)